MKQNYRIHDKDTGLYHSVLCLDTELLVKAEKIGITSFITMTETEYETTDHYKAMLASNKKADDHAIHERYLSKTDWYAIRLVERGIAIPDDIKEGRASAIEHLQ